MTLFTPTWTKFKVGYMRHMKLYVHSFWCAIFGIMLPWCTVLCVSDLLDIVSSLGSTLINNNIWNFRSFQLVLLNVYMTFWCHDSGDKTGVNIKRSERINYTHSDGSHSSRWVKLRILGSASGWLEGGLVCVKKFVEWTASTVVGRLKWNLV